MTRTPEDEFYSDPAPHPMVEAAVNQILVGCPHRYVILGRWRSKKNGKQILTRGRYGHRFVASSRDYKRWERDAVLQLKAQMAGRATLLGPVKVTLAIYLDKGQRQPDRDNARAGTFDALERAGVIKNDSQIEDDPLHFFRDELRPRVEVIVEEILG